MGKGSKRISSGKLLPDSGKKVQRQEDPDGFYQKQPSWRFQDADKENWVLSKDSFWDSVMPFLVSLESMTWDSILRRSNNNHHFIKLIGLSSRAQAILARKKIEAEAVMSLRLQGKIRLYGIMADNVFSILWLDDNHGDNPDCVCRSYLKHT